MFNPLNPRIVTSNIEHVIFKNHYKKKLETPTSTSKLEDSSKIWAPTFKNHQTKREISCFSLATVSSLQGEKRIRFCAYDGEEMSRRRRELGVLRDIWELWRVGEERMERVWGRKRARELGEERRMSVSVFSYVLREFGSFKW